MRKTIIASGLLLTLAVAFAFTRSDVPQIVYDYEPEGNVVTLNFRLHKFNLHGIEIALNNPHIPTFFIQFDVVMQGASPVLTMTGLSNGSQLKGTASRRKLPDFPFLRDKAGNPVLNFTFENQLAQGDAGQAMRMAYKGPPVFSLVDMLVIPEPITLPEAVSRQFGVQEPIQFQPGTLYLDPDFGGFWIPLTPRQDEF